MAEFEHHEELVVGLYDRGAIRFSDFKWTLKSGRLSPLFFNQRLITSFKTSSDLTIDAQRRIRDLAVDGYSHAIDTLGESYDHLYGIPQALTALGGMVAYARGDSMLWGRVGVKDYGIHSDLEGDYSAGDVVVNLDDVITDAASKLQAEQALHKVDVSTAGFVVMFDREEGGAQTVEEAGFSLVAVTGLTAAKDILRDASRIGTQELDWIAQYHQNLRDEGILPPA